MPLNGFFAGGLAQGIDQGQQIMQRQQNAQLEREMMDLRLEQFKQEQEEAKVKRSRLERQLKAQDALQRALGGTPTDMAQRGQSYSSPAPSAMANQSPQRTIDPNQIMQAMAGIDPEAAIKFGAAQRMLPTPKAQQETLESMLKSNKVRMDILKGKQSLVKGQQDLRLGELNYQKGEQDLQLGQQQFGLNKQTMRKNEESIKKAIIDQKLALANVRKTNQGYQIAARKENDLANAGRMLAQGAETGDPAKVRAYALWTAGKPEEAVQTYFSPLAGMSKLELMQQAMDGSTDALNAVMLDSELSEKGGISFTTDENGRMTSFNMGNQKLPPAQASKLFGQMSDVLNMEGMLSMAENEIDSAIEAGNTNVTGLFGSLNQSFGNLTNTVAGWTAKDPEALKVISQLQDDSVSDAIRIDSALTILAAMATRSTLGETGVLTNQDIRRGRKIAGQTPLATPRSVKERLNFLRDTLEQNMKTISKKRDFAMSMAPQESRPFVEQAFKKAGARKKAATPIEGAKQTVQDLDAAIKAEREAIRKLEESMK